MPWPKETPEDLEAFYGKFEFGANGTPTETWKKKNLKTIVTPYPFTLSWDTSLTVSRITCHVLVAESLKRILEAILAHYGSLPAVQQARMHLYGGCYEFRRISGSNKLSTHSYGAGIDLDPEKNALGKPYNTPQFFFGTAGFLPILNDLSARWFESREKRRELLQANV